MNHPTHPPNFWSTGHHHPTTPADPLAGVKLFPWSKPMSNATAKCPNHDSESEGQILASTPSVSNHSVGSLGWLQKLTFQKKNTQKIRELTTHNSIQLIGSPKRTVITVHMVSQFPPAYAQPLSFSARARSHRVEAPETDTSAVVKLDHLRR